MCDFHLKDWKTKNLDNFFIGDAIFLFFCMSSFKLLLYCINLESFDQYLQISSIVKEFVISTFLLTRK